MSPFSKHLWCRLSPSTSWKCRLTPSTPGKCHLFPSSPGNVAFLQAPKVSPLSKHLLKVSPYSKHPGKCCLSPSTLGKVTSLQAPLESVAFHQAPHGLCDPGLVHSGCPFFRGTKGFNTKDHRSIERRKGRVSNRQFSFLHTKCYWVVLSGSSLGKWTTIVAEGVFN